MSAVATEISEELEPYFSEPTDDEVMEFLLTKPRITGIGAIVDMKVAREYLRNQRLSHARRRVAMAEENPTPVCALTGNTPAHRASVVTGFRFTSLGTVVPQYHSIHLADPDMAVAIEAEARARASRKYSKEVESFLDNVGVR